LKKVIAAHDLSGLGKASLGCAIPIISAMGSVVCSLPTAVFSTITGVFEGYSITDLTEQMKNTISHWKSLNTSFDILYSGFLGSPQQVDEIISAINSFEGCYFIADPVFADNGKLYDTMDEEMVANMKRLVSYANVITPNYTEACFLLDEKPGTFTEPIAKAWLKRLSKMGPERVVITSCNLDGNMFVVAYDSLLDTYWKLRCDYVPMEFHGTGDIFTSVLTGALARDDSFEASLTLAAQFVKDAIDATIVENWDMCYGVLMEKVLCNVAMPAANKCQRF
jgi:pyridoxine kinase